MLGFIRGKVNRSDGQVVSVRDCSVNGQGSLPSRDIDCRFSVPCQVIELHAFYGAITGPTEFIISIVNSIKMVNMPIGTTTPPSRRETVTEYY